MFNNRRELGKLFHFVAWGILLQMQFLQRKTHSVMIKSGEDPWTYSNS